MSEDVMVRLRRGETVVVGNKIYVMCGLCKKIVQVNKPFVGSLHFCD
jgi:hypothetical protein